MGKIYDNAIVLQQGFKYTERVLADDRTEVQSLEDLKTLIVPIYFVSFVRDILDGNGLPTGYMWNGQDQTNLDNWINPLSSEKNRITSLENTILSLASGLNYSIPQTGNTPLNEPAPIVDGIYPINTIGTFTNFGNLSISSLNNKKIEISVEQGQTIFKILESNINLFSDIQFKSWVINETFTSSNEFFDVEHNLISADIEWSDGDTSTISNVTTNSYGTTSIRYNRSDGKYATRTIIYDADGFVDTETITLTGF